MVNVSTVQLRLLVASLQEVEQEARELRESEAASRAAANEMATAVREVAPLHEAVVALTADMLARLGAPRGRGRTMA